MSIIKWLDEKIPFIVLFVKLLIASFSDEPVKHIIKFISSCPEGREAAIEKFNDLYFNGDKTDNFVLNDDYIMVKLLSRTLFMKSEDLLWVRDVPAAGGGTNYSLRVYFKNGSFEAISSLSKSDINKYMDILGAKYPYLCYGNTDFLLNEFNNNRDNMINTVEQRRHSI